MRTGLGRAAVRGVLWGLSGALVVLLGALFLLGRRGREAPPPLIGEVPAFSLTERDGRPVSRADLLGAPWIADFIFTRCAGPCPRMTQAMARLGERLPAGVRRVSFTVDPDYDSPEVLSAYAARYGAGPGWLFLTGEREAVWQLSVAGFKLAAAAAEGAATEHGPILHSTRFVLVDGEGRIRGYYDAFEEQEIERLLAELRVIQTGAS